MMLSECFIFGVITFLVTGAQCEVTEVFVEAGSHAVLPCKCFPTSAAQPVITWSKVNKGTIWRRLKSGLLTVGSSWVENGNKRVQCHHTQYEKGDYSLQIDNVRKEDGGVYSCNIEFESNTVQKVTILRVITVFFSPAVPILRMDVSITCSVTPWPNGASVHWMLNNRTYVPHIVITSNKGAKIMRDEATEGMTGNWTCVVGYNGKKGQASTALSVRGIIQPLNDNIKVYAAVGSAVTLPCVFSPGLIPSLAYWERLQPGSLLGPVLGHLPPSFLSPSQSSKIPEDKSARLEEVGFKDEGVYRCSGIVQGQKLTRNIQLVVAHIDSVSSKKKDSVKLTCQLSNTSEVTDYEWVHVTYDINGTQSSESIHKGKTLSISQVSESSDDWICRFSGKDGILGNVTYQVQLMSKFSLLVLTFFLVFFLTGRLSGKKSTGHSQNTGTVVGLSFLLIVLLLILAQMYKNHQRRKRIFQYPALETIVHTISNEREERERNCMKN